MFDIIHYGRFSVYCLLGIRVTNNPVPWRPHMTNYNVIHTTVCVHFFIFEANIFQVKLCFVCSFCSEAGE